MLCSGQQSLFNSGYSSSALVSGAFTFYKGFDKGLLSNTITEFRDHVFACMSFLIGVIFLQMDLIRFAYCLEAQCSDLIG